MTNFSKFYVNGVIPEEESPLGGRPIYKLDSNELMSAMQYYTDMTNAARVALARIEAEIVKQSAQVESAMALTAVQTGGTATQKRLKAKSRNSEASIQLADLQAAAVELKCVFDNYDALLRLTSRELTRRTSNQRGDL